MKAVPNAHEDFVRHIQVPSVVGSMTEYALFRRGLYPYLAGPV